MVVLLLLCLFTQIHATGIEENQGRIVTRVLPTDEEDVRLGVAGSLNAMLQARDQNPYLDLYGPMVNVLLEEFRNAGHQRRSDLVNMIVGAYNRIVPELADRGVIMPPVNQLHLAPEIDTDQFRDFTLRIQGQPLSPLDELVLGVFDEQEVFDQDELEDDLTPVFHGTPLALGEMPQVLYNSPYRQVGQVEQGNQSPLAPNEDLDMQALLMNAALNVFGPAQQQVQNANRNLENIIEDQARALHQLQELLAQYQPADRRVGNPGANVLNVTPPQAARRLFPGSPLRQEVPQNTPEAQEDRRRQAEDSPEGQPPRQRRRLNLEDEPVNQLPFHRNHDDENGPDGGGLPAY